MSFTLVRHTFNREAHLMRKIDRKTADPEILRAYEELRYERRYPKLEIMAWAIRAAAYGGVLPIFFIPEGARPTYLVVWVICLAIAVTMKLFLMIFWKPKGERLKMALIIGAVIGAALIMLAGFYFLAFVLLL
jgi:hypothetical protein